MEATEIIKILNDNGIQLANDIRANIGSAGMWATGETGASLHGVTTQAGTLFKFQLLGREYFMTIQTGRKPTPGKKPSREMIDRIERWTIARGMDEDAKWAIAVDIQNRGTKLWRDGGRTDIVDPAVDDFINNVSLSLAEGGADDLILRVKNMKW